MDNYKEKIRKLLALAESNNEFEAKGALLKAREMMAMYKIAEADLVDMKNKNVKRIETEYTYTKRGEYWMSALAQIIAENYCCRAFATKEMHAQKRTVAFIGLEDDVDLCATVFDYAVKSARSLAKHKIEKETVYCLGRKARLKISPSEKNMLVNSYARGFTSGVKEALREQKETKESEWGLVMVVPAEVNEVIDGFRKDRYVSRSRAVDRDYMNAGREEGRRFNPNNKLSAS